MRQKELPYRKQVLCCQNGGRTIYGVVFLPAAEGKYPLVVYSHELGGSHHSGIPYARHLAALGYAVYTFDFCGGCVAVGRSDGETTEMTLSSEQSDLEAVLAAAEAWEFADLSRLVLFGGSQGGVVSALVAGQRPEAVSGLILLYPAFSAVNHVRALFRSPAEIPEEFDLFGGWIRLGRQYALDLWDRDFYASLAAYEGKTLLLHGDADRTVPLSYSIRASRTLPDCAFHIIPGGEHVFSGPPLEEAKGLITAYLDALFR